MVTKIKNVLLQHHKAISLSIIIFSTVLAYGNTFYNSFVVDDYSFIVNWPLIRDLGNFQEFFGPNNQPVGEEGVYSPFKTCFHAINYALWGLNPFGYHLVALIIHLLGTYFVYRISHLLTEDNLTALLSGLLFGLHPIHVEAITFLTASIDTLGVVFLFASFYFYIQSHEQEKAFTEKYVWSLMFAILAVFTHELTVVLPALFLFYDLCFKQKSNSLSGTLSKVLPFFILSLVYIGMKYFILGSVTRGGYLLGSAYLTLLVIIKALAKYVIVLVFPFQLSLNPEISKGIYSVDWQYFDRGAVLMQSIFDPQVLASLALTAAIIYFAIKMYKVKPLLSFCIGWLYISLMPVLNIIPSESYFAERYLYPGSFGYCLGLAVCLNGLYCSKGIRKINLSGKLLGVCVITIILSYYSVRTVVRNSDWRDKLSFLIAEVQVNPDHAIMQRDLGVVYLNRGNLVKALDHVEHSIALRPLDEDSYFTLAQIYTELDELNKAVESYLVAIDINSNFAEAHYNLGRLNAQLGEMNSARKSLNRAIKLFDDQGKIVEAEVSRKILQAQFELKQ